MESNIEVALAVKLKKLFPATEDKFLSFPMGKGFSYTELNFMEDASNQTAEQLRQENLHKAEFARRLNVIPQDKVPFSEDMSRFLWDEYKNVLNRAELAESILTSNEKKRLQEAEDFLTDVITENGEQVLVYSNAVKKYYEYKTLSDEAERVYLDEKITVETSDDKELKEEWDSHRERQLREFKDKALNDWINLGYKNDVEKYQGIKNSLSQKEPGLYRQSYINDLNVSYETLDPNDPGGTYSTFFSPGNCFDAEQRWTTVTMRKKEINALIRSAPPELKRFITQEQLNIESIALDYKNVVVMRSWFHPEFFKSRYWKLPDHLTISDGKVPRSGKIPAFITGMIVTKNIKVTRRKTAGSEPPPLDLSFFAKHLKLLNTSVLKATQSVRPNFNLVRGSVVTSPTSGHARTSAAVRRKPLTLRSSRHIAAKYAGTTVNTQAKAVPKKKRKKPSDDNLVTDAIELDGVAIIAFDCRRIPKSPNPDETLKWVE